MSFNLSTKVRNMLAGVVNKTGGSIEIVTKPIPEINDDQLLIKVKAAGVNPVDTYIRTGKYSTLPPCPYTPGIDGAGLIEKKGANCTEYNIGDPVYILFATSPHGTYAQYCVASKFGVFPLNPKLSFEQGAAIGIPYYSAHRALYHCANAKPGDTVLVHGASGAVGTAACNLAIANGMKVYGTAGTDVGREALLKLGVTEVFNHRENGYVESILNNNLNFDVIIECLANVNLSNDLLLAAQGGRIIIVGSRGATEIDPRKILQKELTVKGMYLLVAKPEEIASSMKDIHSLIDQGKVTPLIGSSYSLEQSNDAHMEVIQHTDGSRGKIVIVL